MPRPPDRDARRRAQAFNPARDGRLPPFQRYRMQEAVRRLGDRELKAQEEL
jgi:hypothetical protein